MPTGTYWISISSGTASRNMFTFARRVAWIAGVLLPIGETWRRWEALWAQPVAYVDDLVMGALFLLGAAMAGRGARGARWLVAAYGCALGVMSLSLVAGIGNMSQPDPSGVSGVVAVMVKLAMTALVIVGLIGAIFGDAPEAR